MYPRYETQLAVTAHHKIHIMQFGNTQAPAILFIHGGPASGCQASLANLFPLDHCQLIMFDQRGSGQSKPLGEVKGNTTQALISDIEVLRKHLNIPQWEVVYGGSWGATLAIEYAKAHRNQVNNMLLRGSFLARPKDLAWFVSENGLAQQQPQAYKKLIKQIQPENHDQLLQHINKLLVQDTKTAYKTVVAWNDWECTAMNISPPPALDNPIEQSEAIKRLQLYLHYCLNQFFLPQQGVLAGIEQLHDLPCIAIHGTDDQVCPLHLAKDLKLNWSCLDWREVDAGHGLFEPKIKQALQYALQGILIN